MAKDFVTPEQYQRGVGKIKDYVDNLSVIAPLDSTSNDEYVKVNLEDLELTKTYIVPKGRYIGILVTKKDGTKQSVLVVSNTCFSIYVISGNKGTANRIFYYTTNFGSYKVNVTSNIDNNGKYIIKQEAFVLGADNLIEYNPQTPYSPATKKYVDDSSKLVKEDINNGIIDIKNEIDSLYYGNSSSDNYKTILYNDVLKGKFIYSEECKRGLTTGTAYFININDSKLVNDSLTMVFFKIKYKDSNNRIFNDICYEGANDNFECSIKNNESKIYVTFRLRINKEITSDGTINEKNKSLILQVSIWDKTKYIGNENILETIEINMHSKMRNYLPISSNPAADYTPTKDYQPTNKKYVDDTVVFKKLSSIVESTSDGKKIINVEKFEDNKVYYFINDINEGTTTLIPILLYKGGEKNSIIMIYPNDRFVTMSYNVSANEFFSFSDMQSVKYNLVDKTREYNNSRSVTKKVSAEQVLTKTNTTAFTPTSDYHPTTKKYVDEKVVGLATESYVDSKTSMENVIYEGNGTGADVISDYWTGCPVSSGNGCWVINKQIEFDSSKPNPYYLLCDTTLYSPENSTFDKTNSAWIYPKVHNTGTIFICNKYNGENKLVLPWDNANSPSKMKLYTKTELATAISDGDLEATSDEVKAMLANVLGGDYSGEKN